MTRARTATLPPDEDGNELWLRMASGRTLWHEWAALCDRGVAAAAPLKQQWQALRRHGTLKSPLTVDTDRTLRFDFAPGCGS